MRELLLATGNAGKVPQLVLGLGDIPFKIISLKDVQLLNHFEVEEPGTTYEAHAAIKAIIYSKHTGRLTLADDSGLEIDALGGEPGVQTANYFLGTWDERIQKMLDKMKGVPEGNRRAQYSSVIATYDPTNDRIRFAEGVTSGSIALEARGSNAFGYDPIFLSDDLGKTFGECSLEELTRVSHRGRALAKARKILLTEFV